MHLIFFERDDLEAAIALKSRELAAQTGRHELWIARRMRQGMRLYQREDRQHPEWPALEPLVIGVLAELEARGLLEHESYADI